MRKKKNPHLPPRVIFKHGAYYYVMEAGYVDGKRKQKLIRLGVTFHDAMSTWATLVEKPKNLTTMNELFDRYMIEVSPKKAKKTYEGNIRQMKMLRPAFGNMLPADIEPMHVYQYLSIRKDAGAAVGGNREKALLSHVFSYARRWGVVRDNPCLRVERNSEKPRDRYIHDDEFLSVKSIATPFLSLLMDLAYLTGQRRGDLLKIKRQDLLEDGIYFEQGKSIREDKPIKKLIIGWTEELRKCVEAIKALNPNVKGMQLFCKQNGQPYTDSGVDTAWGRLIDKAIEKELINERFNFHDIRAKASSDAENIGHASKLLGHATEAMTKKVYDRKARVVRALK